MLCQQPSSVTDALASISFVISPCLRFTIETVQELTKAIQRLRVLLLLTHDWIWAQSYAATLFVIEVMGQCPCNHLVNCTNLQLILLKVSFLFSRATRECAPVLLCDKLWSVRPGFVLWLLRVLVCDDIGTGACLRFGFFSAIEFSCSLFNCPG